MGRQSQRRECDKHLSVKTRVKSGCRTCRIRKVKCDQGRPVCDRCLSTGRVCDGYGIWGGGGNFYGCRQSTGAHRATNASIGPGSSLALLSASVKEKKCLEWFQCRTTRTIPGAFILTFWDTLVHQAVVNEPAVFHAVLTLSSTHEWKIVKSDTEQRADDIPDKQEGFALWHYNQAIRHLQSRLLGRDRSTLRVALISCIIFVCLEFLRGHFRTALNHFHNGLNVLNDMQLPSGEGLSGTGLLPSLTETTDVWILEAFSRLRFQMMLFNHKHIHPRLALQSTSVGLVVSPFRSLKDAWQQMEALFDAIFSIAEQSRRLSNLELMSSSCPHPQFGSQQRIKKALAVWLHTYQASKSTLQGVGRQSKGYRLLHAYHTMAVIHAGTCLYPGDESLYDSYSEHFTNLLCQMIDHQRGKSPDLTAQDLLRHSMSMSRSIIDVGWIPPLYYTALKCRIHRVRLHAIRLLETTSHREGIWDSHISAYVARKVMEIEERDICIDLATKDRFDLSSYPSSQDLLSPALPLSVRIRDVEVEMPDGPTDDVLLHYKQQNMQTGWQSIVEVYNMRSQVWSKR